MGLYIFDQGQVSQKILVETYSQSLDVLDLHFIKVMVSTANGMIRVMLIDYFLARRTCKANINFDDRSSTWLAMA